MKVLYTLYCENSNKKGADWMEFKSSFFSGLNERFKEELFLTELFLDFYRKLEEFDNALEKYTSVGLDVLFEAAENAAVLKIEDSFLRFDLVFHEALPLIQVSTGHVSEEEPLLIDHIYADKLEYPASLYWQQGQEAAFDAYLKAAFERILKG